MNNNFIDRIEEREFFWKKYYENGTSIINYYGLGGIGKTKLITELMNELKEKEKNAIEVYLDLEKFQFNVEILRAIRDLLYRNYKMNFKRFDIALSVYYKKTPGSESQMHINKFLEESNLEPFKNFVSGTSIVGYTLMEILNKLVDVGNSLSAKQFINSLELETPRTLEEKLASFLAQDINEYLAKKKTTIVFFLDSFEKLDKDLMGSRTSIHKINWFKNIEKNGLVDLIDNSKWVIGSREEISNLGNIDSFGLKRFNKEHTIEYLKNEGITDEQLCDDLYNKYSGGIPLVLVTCVRNCDISSQELLIENFSSDIPELVERILEGLDTNSLILVYLLSYIRSWTDSYFTEIGQRCLKDFSSYQYRYGYVKKFSFIIEGQNGNYYFDKTIKKLMLNENLEIYQNMKPILENIKDELTKYYKEKLTENQETISLNDKINILNEYIEYNLLESSDIDKSKDYYELIVPVIEQIKNSFHFENAYELYNEIEEIYKNNSDIYNNIIENEINLLYLLGKYDSQRELAEKYYKLNNSAKSKELLAISYMYNGNYSKSLALLNEIPLKNDEINFNIAEVNSRLGLYDTALDIYNNLLQSKSDDESRNNIEASIAKIYSFKRDYIKAIDIYKKILNIDTDDILNYIENNIRNFSFDELKIINDISNTYSNNGEFEKALKLSIMLKNIYEEYLGKEHPFYLNELNDIGMIYSHNNNYDEALKILTNTYEERKRILGENNIQTIASMNNLGTVKLYYGKSKSDSKLINEALEHLNLAYAKRIEILGNDNPFTMNTLFNIAIAQSSLNDNEKAIENARIVYNYRKDKFGENIDSTIKAKKLLEKLEENK